MAFVLIGLVLLAMKVGEFGPVEHWSWVWVLSPFGLAVLWWGFSDKFGLTQLRAMKKIEDRKAERRERSLEALGIDARRERKVGDARTLARRAAAHNPPPKPAAPVAIDPPRPPGEPPRKEPSRF